MNIRRKLFAAVLALALVLSMAFPVFADDGKTSDSYIQQMMNYYRYYQDAASTDIDCLLYALSEVNPGKAQTWQSIMDYWHQANTAMLFYPGVLPDGLPQDNSLCIVVMGYALASDGSMRSELIGRLETALASAEKYPNAYIVCTGGGTARDDKTVTEAGQMAKWLMQKGVSGERIIVEDEAMSTVGNAKNTCRILAEQYPRVTHLALVTSDYHLVRSCLLFHAQSLLSADKGAPLLCVAANAAYITNRSTETVDIQADNLSALVNIPINGMPKPTLSKLERITLSAPATGYTGQEPETQVIAHYSTGFYRDVTENVTFSGLDLTTAGIQELVAAYEENGIAVSASAQIELLIPETQAPTEAPTEVPTEAPTETPAELPTQPAPEVPPQISDTQTPPADSGTSMHRLIPPVAAMAVLLLAVLFIARQLIRNKKRQKAQIPDDDPVELPDDDSPLEYI